MNSISCLNCGQKLIGRTDKRYCSDSCRTSYHNRKRCKSIDAVRKVDYILHKNRNILKKIRSEKEIIPKNYLRENGFNFRYHTHIHQVAEGPVLYFCYEYGYYGIDKEHCALIRKT